MINNFINHLKSINNYDKFSQVKNLLNYYSYYISPLKIMNMNHDFNNEKNVFYDNLYIKNIEDKNDYVKFQFFKNSILESYFIYWKPNSYSKIHNHPENGCYYTILNNTMEEHIYDKNLNLLSLAVIQPREVNYIDDDLGYHKMVNNSEKFTTSIHIYSPINSKTNVFD